jgi:hypothetical protein
MSMQKFSTFLFALAVAGVVAPRLAAVTTDTAIQVSYDHFEDGNLTNIAIPSEGGLRLAPALDSVAKLDAAIIWRAVADASGNLYVSTGNAGKVFKVTPDGNVTTLFQPGETLVRALAVDAKGNLYVGTSPDGYVYRIAPGGAPEVYFHSSDTYIWDLKFDTSGNLFVATGSKARVYRLPPDYQPGQPPEVYFESDRTHISWLAFAPDGSLLAAAEPKSLVYRITAKDKATVLVSPGGQEITGLWAAADGSVYLTTFNKPGPGASPGAAGADHSGGSAASSGGGSPPDPGDGDDGDDPDSGSDSDSGGSGSLSAPPASAGAALSQFLHVSPSGFVEQVWSLSKVGLYSFRALPDGRWLLGSDQHGRLFNAASRQDWSLIQSTPDSNEVSVLLPVPGDEASTYVFASNPAQIFRLGAKPAPSGNYTCSPFDADQTARWGTLRALALPPLPSDPLAGAKWETRTGNTPKPDDTWADWQAVGNDTTIASPPGRYFQYRVTLADPAEGVRRLSVYFQHFDAAPVVDRVGVVPVGVEVIMPPPQHPPLDLRQISDDDGSGAPPPPEPHPQLRPTGEAGAFTAAWHATDPDDDDLVYTVQLRAVGDDKWVTLADDLDQSVFSFSSRGYTDGYYQVRVIASDKLDNPPGQARTGEHISSPFLINNTAPVVSLETQVGDASTYTLTFHARDAASVLDSAQYTVDGQPAKPALPDGGMFDKPEHDFHVVLDHLKSGAHSVVFQVTDDAGNSGTATANFDIP